MAHDKTKKIEIRAFYESHNLSYAKVAEHFIRSGYQINHKTIENWGGSEGWKKSRYTTLTEALDNMIDKKVIDLIPIEAKNLVKSHIEREMGETMEPDVIEAMSESISQELTYLTLNNRYLSTELALNLMNAKKFATKSLSIQTNNTYHDMILKTFQAINGKNEDMPLINPEANTGFDKPLADMTWEELEALRREHE